MPLSTQQRFAGAIAIVSPGRSAAAGILALFACSGCVTIGAIEGLAGVHTPKDIEVTLDPMSPDPRSGAPEGWNLVWNASYRVSDGMGQPQRIEQRGRLAVPLRDCETPTLLMVRETPAAGQYGPPTRDLHCTEADAGETTLPWPGHALAPSPEEIEAASDCSCGLFLAYDRDTRTLAVLDHRGERTAAVTLPVDDGARNPRRWIYLAASPVLEVVEVAAAVVAVVLIAPVYLLDQITGNWIYDTFGSMPEESDEPLTSPCPARCAEPRAMGAPRATRSSV